MLCFDIDQRQHVDIRFVLLPFRNQQAPFCASRRLDVNFQTRWMEKIISTVSALARRYIGLQAEQICVRVFGYHADQVPVRQDLGRCPLRLIVDRRPDRGENVCVWLLNDCSVPNHAY